MTVRQTRRDDIDFTTTHAHPRGFGAMLCQTLVVCSDCGVGNYRVAREERPDPWECTVCGHGVHCGDLEPNLEPGESLGTLGYGTHILMTVDVKVDRDSITTRPEDDR